MKQRTIDKCWDEIASFWEAESPPTEQDKIAHAYRETYGKVPDGLIETQDPLYNKPYSTWAKQWKTWHITEWIAALVNMKAELFPWEVPVKYRHEVYSGVHAIMRRDFGYKSVLPLEPPYRLPEWDRFGYEDEE